ncbi:30S ribosomal protein S27e [Candidatus Nitrososphaera gargensis Ga9.2]|uniref:Small ribosomal subunit protein eS27 n=2 Tax=Candidatus Nitrososphaera gargensis TaxID=497727 RepID=K0IBX3_NITGG
MKKENIMVPKPRSAFLSVQCEKCGEKAIVFSHTTTNINCKSCGELLAERSGGLANIYGKVLGALDE